VTPHKQQGKKRMAKSQSVARKRTPRDVAAEMANDPEVVESVASSMEDLDGGLTISFEEAFGEARPHRNQSA
jgi:hypothetical protein